MSKKLKDPKELIIEELYDIVTLKLIKNIKKGVIVTPRFNIGDICNAPGILYGLILKFLWGKEFMRRRSALAGVVCISVYL